MSEPYQAPVNLASHQPSTQAKEVAVLALICILRLLSQPLASDLKTSPGTEASVAVRSVYAMAVSIKLYLTVIVASEISCQAVMQLPSRTMPRRMLDAIGILFAMFILLRFIKIHLLMRVIVGPADVSLPGVVIYVFCFAVMWGPDNLASRCSQQAGCE